MTHPTPDNPHTDPETTEVRLLRQYKDASDADIRDLLDGKAEALARAETAEREATELGIAISGGCGCPAPYDTCTHDEPLLHAVNRLTEQNRSLAADRDDLAARIEALEDAIRSVLYLHGDPKSYTALRALVSPDTPTGPTDTVDRHEAYTMDAEGYIVPVSGGEPHTDTSTVWCVKHRDGWCATKDNHEPAEGTCNVPTRCGYWVTLPGGYDQRQPDCPDCILLGDPPSAGGDQPDTPAETMAWAWCVIRDDGDRCAGPFDTEDEADRKLRTLFDTSEYRVDYQ
jgi:hypothetical protein